MLIASFLRTHGNNTEMQIPNERLATNELVDGISDLQSLGKGYYSLRQEKSIYSGESSTDSKSDL